jgi:hypothetical protein
LFSATKFLKNNLLLSISASMKKAALKKAKQVLSSDKIRVETLVETRHPEKRGAIREKPAFCRLLKK